MLFNNRLNHHNNNHNPPRSAKRCAPEIGGNGSQQFRSVFFIFLLQLTVMSILHFGWCCVPLIKAAYLIFVTGTMGGARGEKLSCGEICPYDRLSGGEILHMTDCHVENILHMRNVKKI